MDTEAIADQMREILVLEVCTVDEQGKAVPMGRMYEMTRQEFLSTHLDRWANHDVVNVRSFHPGNLVGVTQKTLAASDPAEDRTPTTFFCSTETVYFDLRRADRIYQVKDIRRNA